SFRRGEEYEQAGAVLRLVRRGDMLEAEVEGSAPEPYRARVILDAAGFVAADCTCPYDWGGWCKHLVAALLASLHRPDLIEGRPPLDHLRQHRPFDPRGEVDIFLHEGLIDDAIAMVQPYVGSYYSDELIETVVRAAVASHPAWVIATCTRRTGGIMYEGRSQLYDLAVRWLAYARDAHRFAGREGEWAEYLRALIEQHRRKYRPRPMLEA